MPRRMSAQQHHVIDSIDRLCIQFQTLSFLLSPSIWLYLTRVTSQAVLVRVRDIDSEKPIAWWMLMVGCFNLGNLYYHAVYGASEGSAVLLDFVGMSYRASRLELLLLDAVIVSLQAVLAIVAFETSLAEDTTQVDTDMLSSAAVEQDQDSPQLSDGPTYVLDITLKQVRSHFWKAPPAYRPAGDSMQLPLPVTTRLPVSRTLNRIIRNRRERQVRANQQASPRSAVLPGALEPHVESEEGHE